MLLKERQDNQFKRESQLKLEISCVQLHQSNERGIQDRSHSLCILE